MNLRNPFTSPAHLWRIQDIASITNPDELRSKSEHHRIIALSERRLADKGLAEVERMIETDRHQQIVSHQDVTRASKATHCSASEKLEFLVERVIGPLLTYVDRLAASEFAKEKAKRLLDGKNAR